MRLDCSCACSTSDRLRSVKSSSWPRLYSVALAQQVADLPLDFAHVRFLADLDENGADGALLGGVAPQYPVAGGGDRHQDHVVLVLAQQALALAAEGADHHERHLADADHLPERVAIAEQVAYHRFAEQRDLGRAGEIRRVETLAGGDHPIAHLEMLGRDPVEHCRPVVVARHHLAGAAQLGSSCLHFLDLALDGVGVVLRQRVARARAHARSARGHRAGKQHDQVRAERLDLFLHTRLGARAHPDHGDHGGNADDDAEHGERAAKLVDPQRAQRNPYAREPGHAATSDTFMVMLPPARRWRLRPFAGRIPEKTGAPAPPLMPLPYRVPAPSPARRRAARPAGHPPRARRGSSRCARRRRQCRARG